MKKYKGLRIHTPESIEELSIEVVLAVTENREQGSESIEKQAK